MLYVRWDFFSMSERKKEKDIFWEKITHQMKRHSLRSRHLHRLANQFTLCGEELITYSYFYCM